MVTSRRACRVPRWRVSVALALALVACSAAPERKPEEAIAKQAAAPKAAASLAHAPSAAPPNAAPSTELAANTQLVAATQTAQPDPAAAELAALMALPGSHSMSFGAPGYGELRGGVALPETGPGFLHNPKRPPGARYGTVEMIQAIVKAAEVTSRELPGIPLVVNDISAESGGRLAQHGSHQSGRDADILFYVLDKNGEPLQSVGVPIEPDGTGFDFKDLSVLEDDIPLRLDARRTWRFVQALFEAAEGQVQRIFLVEHVRAMLLAEAERVHAPRALRDRFAEVTCQPGTPHDDHMHVRFYCSPEDMAGGCFDTPPTYPWRKDALAALGLVPALERRGDRKARAQEVAERTTSIAEARKSAGPMHKKVRAFLARRNAWVKTPHPGREFCK